MLNGHWGTRGQVEETNASSGSGLKPWPWLAPRPWLGPSLCFAPLQSGEHSVLSSLGECERRRKGAWCPALVPPGECPLLPCENLSARPPEARPSKGSAACLCKRAEHAANATSLHAVPLLSPVLCHCEFIQSSGKPWKWGWGGTQTRNCYLTSQQMQLLALNHADGKEWFRDSNQGSLAPEFHSISFSFLEAASLAGAKTQAVPE